VNRIGLVTIGQSPRVDIVPDIRTALPASISITEAGALDGLPEAEILAHPPASKKQTLCSRLADGTEVQFDKGFAHERLQQVIRTLEDNVALIGLLCSGSFTELTAKVPLLIPNKLLQGYLTALSLPGPWGMLVPKADQVEPILAELEGWGVDAVGTALSPYAEGDRLEQAVRKLVDRQVSAILLNCFGFTLKMKARAQAVSQKPVIAVGSMFIHALAELVTEE
jgi:protein AroM